MESVHVERLDHLGVMASVSKDIELLEMMNARLVPDAQAVLTPGEAMAGMRLNGLGVAHRPLSLTPQFFANKPLEQWFREGLRAEMCNRFKRGRTLDEADPYGCALWFHELALADCALWFHELALAVCAHEGLDLRCKHLDTTSVALHGEYVRDSEAQAMTSPSGSSTEHRPDLKPAVLALRVSQDGGVPVGSKSGDGHTSDSKVFQERAQALLATFQKAPSPRSLIADSKLSHEDKAPNRPTLGFSTRIPHTRRSVSQVIRQALAWDTWHRLDADTRDQGLALCHDGMAQRWLIVQSNAALERAETTLTKARRRAEAALTTPRLHRHATRCQTAEVAQEALAALAQRWTDHHVDSSTLIAHKRDGGKGRPTPHPPLKAIAWHIQAQVRPHQEAMRHQQPVKACVVLGTTIDTSELRDAEVLAAYTGQSSVEGGCRLLKDPRLFVSSLFVQKPRRIAGLLMVMPLAWLGYSVAQRRRRQP